MQTLTRRKLLHITGTAALAVPASQILMNTTGLAQDAARLQPDNPTAVALGYVHDTTQVDPTQNPRHEITQTCSNCTLIQASEGEWRPCAIFPGKTVNANGWCKSWAPKT